MYHISYQLQVLYFYTVFGELNHRHYYNYLCQSKNTNTIGPAVSMPKKG